MSPRLRTVSDVTLNRDKFTVQGTMAKLEITIMREMCKLCDPDLKE